MGMPAQIRSSNFQPGVVSYWGFFVNGDAGSNPLKQFSAGGGFSAMGIENSVGGTPTFLSINSICRDVSKNHFKKL